MTRPAPDTSSVTLRPEDAAASHPLEQLTPQERAVFHVLEQHAGKVLSRAELARRAGIADLSTRRCDSLIVGIRRQIGAERVRTVRRRGWMLVA
jgi:DNA-binding response OmpR family regulator